MKNTIQSFIIFLTIVILCSCNNFTGGTDKVVFYAIDTAYYKNHPEVHPSVSIKSVDSLFNDLESTGKELSPKQAGDINQLINSNFYHGNADCGTIWKDGVFIFYNNKGRIDKYAVVSLDCYDLLLYKGNTKLGKINLNEEGKKILFTLFK
jgi:hypothetical protein